MLSEQDIIAIEARANAATEGPWQVQSLLGEKDGAWYLGARAYRRRDEDLDEPPELAPGVYHDDVDVIEFDEHICGCESTTGTNPSDPEFIAHARSDVPALLAEVRRQRGLLHRAAITLREYSAPGRVALPGLVLVNTGLLLAEEIEREPSPTPVPER